MKKMKTMIKKTKKTKKRNEGKQVNQDHTKIMEKKSGKKNQGKKIREKNQEKITLISLFSTGKLQDAPHFSQSE